MFSKGLMALGIEGAEVAKTMGMYGGGTFLGAAAGGMMNLMSGDQEDFIGSVMGGAAMGLAGGAAVRSLTSRGGYLNDFGLAIGRTMDSGAEVRRAERLTKLDDKLAKAEDGSEEALKISEQITALKNEEGGGMTRFFTGLAETAEERQSRVMKEYGSLSAKGKDVTESEANRMAKMESEYGIGRKMEEQDVDVIYARETDTDNFRAMNEDEFNAFIDERKKNQYMYQLSVEQGPSAQRNVYTIEASGNYAKYQNFNDTIGTYTDVATTQKRVVPGAGYEMHQSAAQNTISSRNRGLIVGGAGLTGAMVGYSHSSGRKNKRRGFNSTRGSRF